MKHLCFFVLCFLIVGCNSVTPTADTLGGLLAAQDSATQAARDYQSISGRATTIAEATRQFTILKGQQTQIAGQLRATQVAGSATETWDAQLALAQALAVKANATGTAVAANYTATSVAASTYSTSVAAALIVSATVTSGSATAVANAASASSTAVSVAAVATTTAAGVTTQLEREKWTRATEGAWAVFRILVMLCVVGIFSLFAWRAIEIFVLRRRAFRDANGELVMLLPTKDGNETIARPGRMPGPALLLTPSKADAVSITSPVADQATTMRDQGVSLVLATAGVDGHAGASKVVQALTEDAEKEEAEPVIRVLEPRQLDLNEQPSRIALPVGMTDQGPLWIRLSTIIHGLVAGSSGTGKSRLLHGWVLAIQRGGLVDLALYDGKDGIEFERYAGSPRTTYLNDKNLVPFLDAMIKESARRNEMLKSVGATTVDEYNGTGATPLPHQILIIDEIAVAMGIKYASERIEKIARESRSSGDHLIFATQHPTTKVITQTILANSLLRIAFSVPHHVNSVAILGCSGAEKLGGEPGRMLIFYRGQMITAQTFQVELPKPQLESGAVKALSEPSFSELPVDVTEDQIREMVRHALTEGEGVFKVTQVVRGLGIRSQTVTSAAQWLEGQGLLGEVEKDEHGYNVGRQISPALRELVLSDG